MNKQHLKIFFIDGAIKISTFLILHKLAKLIIKSGFPDNENTRWSLKAMDSPIYILLIYEPSSILLNMYSQYKNNN